MGTSIDCLFAYQSRWGADALQERLDKLSGLLGDDPNHIRAHGHFSQGIGNWHVLVGHPAEPA